MCGIAGYVARREDPGALSAMLSRIAHRGPDGEGRWDTRHGDFTVSLGHRRLAIIDLGGGAQPLSNEDDSVYITFNGEIFNFPQLRPMLEAKGHRFRTNADTEAIVHHFEDRGVDGIADLNGMFAFAIWDKRRGRLTLARDRAGIKPLYWTQLADGGIVFASELAAVLAHPAVQKTISPEGLASYFFSDYAHPPTTLIAGVNKLAPGHFLVWQDGEIREERAFFTLGQGALVVDASRSEDDLASELWDRLGTSVERQLLADVPVGVFLSGGLDSSTVAVLAQQRASYRLKTFSIGFESKTFDESDYARLVAKQIGSEHIEEVLSPSTMLGIVDQALDGLDEPFGDPSFLPTYLLSRLAARHVKVALGGDGGDELWAGYPTYKAHLAGELYRRVPKLLRAGLVDSVVSRLPVRHTYQSFEWKAKRFALRFDDDKATRHLRWMSSTDLPDLADALHSARRPIALSQPVPHLGDALNDICGLDFVTYLPGSVLTKVDRASMAHGLEARPPFLDNDFVDWSMSVPGTLKLRRNTSKYLLKQAALRHLPPEIVLRPKKGFAIPLAEWLRGPLRGHVADALATPLLWDAGLRQETFQRWAREHDEMRVDRSKPLWALIVLARWARRVF